MPPKNRRDDETLLNLPPVPKPYPRDDETLLNLPPVSKPADYDSKISISQREAEQTDADSDSQVSQAEAGPFELDSLALYRKLRQVGLALHGTLSYHQVLDTTLETVTQLIPCEAVNLMLVHGPMARMARWRGYSEFDSDAVPVVDELAINDTPVLRKLYRAYHENKEVQILRIRDVYNNEDWRPFSKLGWEQSFLGATIPGRRGVAAFLNLSSVSPNYFTATHAEILSLFLEQTTLAFQNVNLYDLARQETTSRIRALRRERNFISTILDTAGALVITLNPQGYIINFNRASERISGYKFKEVNARRFWDKLIAEAEVEDTKARLLESPIDSFPLEFEGHLLTKDGQRRAIAWSITITLDHNNGLEYIITTGIDITQRQHAEEALRQSEQRYALAAKSANDGLWDWDLTGDRIYFAPRWKAILGYQDDEISSDPAEWFDRVHSDDLPLLKSTLQKHLDGQTNKFEHEHRMKQKNGRYCWVLSRGLAVRDEAGNAYRVAGSHTDITQRKMAEARLFHGAFHDALTDLPNRTLFIERLEGAIEQANYEPDYEYAVLFLDLDRFKVINDSLGHLVGDQLLIGVSNRLREMVNEGDTVARFGGDEFAILLDQVSGEQASDMAEKIQAELARSFEIDGHTVFTGASIGIALSRTGYEWAEDILRDADTTMYRAKTLGRSRHETFEAGLRTQVMSIWRLEADLRRAVEEEQFRLFYQPIISLTTGQVVGVEALLRWQHPERGYLSPREFVPLIEETGLIVPLGEWILQTACAQTKAWHNMGHYPLWVSVNIAPQQGRHRELPNQVKAALHNTGLDPQALKLEITENFTTSDTDNSLGSFEEFSNLGIRVAVDDFGIGSSLGFLTRFPINTLKIDRSFVENIVTQPSDAAIVKAIISMAHTLKLDVIAEGIETEGQLKLLLEYQCDNIQGYFFSRAVPGAEMTAFLNQWHPPVIITSANKAIDS